MLQESQGLHLQPITASLDSSIQEKLLLFFKKAQGFNDTVDDFLRETEDFEESLKKKADEDLNTPLDIQENLLKAFENEEERQIHQNLAHQKSENG